MSVNGYIQIQHEIFRCDDYISAPADQCKVLTTILDRACFAPCIQDDHGMKIHLVPGQLLTTYRDLGDLSGTNKDVAERAIKRFAKCEILRQEIRHVKSILTILWGVIYKTGTTGSTTGLRQDYDIKQQDNQEDMSVLSVIAHEEEGMFVLRSRRSCGIISIREEDLTKELLAKNFTLEEIEDAMKTARKNNPMLSANAQIQNYVKGIIEKKREEQKKGEHYDQKHRHEQRKGKLDSVRSSAATFERSSIREPRNA